MHRADHTDLPRQVNIVCHNSLLLCFLISEASAAAPKDTPTSDKLVKCCWLALRTVVDKNIRRSCVVMIWGQVIAYFNFDT